MKHFETLSVLLVEQLQDIFDAENQLLEVLPRMAVAARSSELRAAFADHCNETTEHLARLRDVFGKLDVKAERKTCAAMTALIAEANTVIKATGDPNVIDAALIATAQRFEHYKMAGYGCTKAFAKCEDRDDITDILNESIVEAGNADKLLTKIAVGGIFRKSINQEAAKA